jgi:hypothetical protein
MQRVPRAFVTFVTTLAAGGTCFQLGGCDLLGFAAGAVSSINPCGTLLFCDPAQYEFANSGIDGPGVRPDIDPFCTYAPFCGEEDPIFGGLAP